MKSIYQENLKNLKNTVSIISLAAALLVPSGYMAHAADDTTEDVVFEEIIVSASRRDISLQDTALSVTAVKPADFAVGGLVSLREILEYTPGVVYAGGSSPGNNKISMRGVSSFTSSSTVGIYIDDVPLGSGNSFAAGATQALDAMQNDIERVEVIKGPQGTLYGSSSMGGVIRYITRDPSTGDMTASAKIDLSSTKEGGFNQLYSARLSAPIVKDKLGVSVSGYYQDNNGFIDRIAGSPTGAAEDVNGFETYGITAKAVANLSDDFSASLLYLRTKSTFTGRNTVVLEGPPFVPVDGPYETDTGASVATGNFALYAGTLKYAFDGATLISSTSYEKRNSADEADLVADFGGLIELFSGTGAGSVTSAPFTGSTKTNKFIQEVRLASDESETFEWTIGGIYSKENSGNGQKLEGQPVDFLLLDIDFPSELEEYAAFGNLTYYLTEKFDVTAGVRVAKVNASVQITDGPQLLVQNTELLTVNATHDTYSLSARYRPHDDLSFYARIASGYRPASANLPVGGAQPIIFSDTLWSYEIGAKGKMPDANFSYDFALWYIDWSDLQATLFFNGVSSAGNLNSDVTAYGMEGSLFLNPVEGLDIIPNFAYTSSTLDDDETIAFGALAGENLPGLPKWTASIRANYDFPLSDGFDGFVGGGLRYVGSRDSGFEGGIGADGSQIEPLIANILLDDYVMADIRAGIIMDNITASIYVKNLFNEYTFVGGTARPGVGNALRATVVIAEPRTIGAVIKIDF